MDAFSQAPHLAWNKSKAHCGCQMIFMNEYTFLKIEYVFQVGSMQIPVPEVTLSLISF